MFRLLPKDIPSVRIDPFAHAHLLEKTFITQQHVDQETESNNEHSQTNVPKTEAEFHRMGKRAGGRPTPLSKTNPTATIATPTTPNLDTATPDQKEPEDMETTNKDISSTSTPSSTPTPTPTFVSLFYPLRKQSQPDRISTIEALTMLLDDLGEPEEVTVTLLDLLRVSS
jgi:hypothetical protein